MFMFFKREALEKVGNFDERYFVTYEEIDLRVRFDRCRHEVLYGGGLLDLARGQRHARSFQNNRLGP